VADAIAAEHARKGRLGKEHARALQHVERVNSGGRHLDDELVAGGRRLGELAAQRSPVLAQDSGAHRYSEIKRWRE
jgi:hypothetical protein